MTTAIEKRKTMKSIVQKYKGEFAQALPKMINSERFVRVALTQFTKNPDLAECTPESVIGCLLNAAGMGLEVDGRVAHLIPFKFTCTLIVDYKGLVELALRSGLVSFIHADVVCENDEFEEDKGQVITHKINRREPRGEAYAVYTYVKMKDGSESYHIMGRYEVEEIRDNHSIGYNYAKKKNRKDNPWMTRPNEMWKKTCFRQHSKWLPLSAEFRDAVDTDPDMSPTPIDMNNEVDILPVTIPDASAGESVRKKKKGGKKKTIETPDAGDQKEGAKGESKTEVDEPPVQDPNSQDNQENESGTGEDGNTGSPTPQSSKLGKPSDNSITGPAPKRTLNGPDDDE